MQEIDILKLDRLQQRRETGQNVAGVIFGLGSVATLLVYGGRAMLALLLVFVLMSLLMFRGYRWAALALFGLAFTFIIVMLGLLGYDAFFYDRPPDLPFRETYESYVANLFYGVAAVSTVAGWFLMRGLVATVQFSRILIPLPVNALERTKAWSGAVRRFLGRPQAWLLLLMLLVTVFLASPHGFLFYLDMVVFGRPYLSNQFNPGLWLSRTGLPAWAGIGVMTVSVLFMIWLLVRAYGRFRQLLAEASAEAQRRDPRPPVLLLRSFADDLVTVWPSHGFYLSTTGNTMERTLERVLRSVGPVIAIGRPGEALPPLGAAREYLAGEIWRSRVQNHIRQAQLIAVVLGKSKGLVFEYELLAQYGALSKSLLIIPPEKDSLLAPRWERFTRHALDDANLLPPDLATAIVVLFPDGRSPLCIRHSQRRADASQYSLALQMALQCR